MAKKVIMAIIDDYPEQKCKRIIEILKLYEVPFDTFKTMDSFIRAIENLPDGHYAGMFLDGQFPRSEGEKVVEKNAAEMLLRELKKRDIEVPPFILNSMTCIKCEELKEKMYAQVIGLGTRNELEVICAFIKKCTN